MPATDPALSYPLLISCGAKVAEICLMKNNNHQPAPVYCTLSVRINAAPDKIWAILTNVDNWPSWNQRITRAKCPANQSAPGVSFDWKVNGMNIHSVFMVVDYGKCLSWVGKTLGASAEHSWYLEPDKEGTLVRVEERMWGWLIRLFKNKMNKDLRADMRYWLDALKEESERPGR
jgi:hypothetical protein